MMRFEMQFTFFICGKNEFAFNPGRTWPLFPYTHSPPSFHAIISNAITRGFQFKLPVLLSSAVVVAGGNNHHLYPPDWNKLIQGLCVDGGAQAAARTHLEH